MGNASPTQPIPAELLLQLESAARAASANSYSPYSRFAVGAAIAAESGAVYSGCNVENASFGLTNCAERTAIFKAAADGVRSIRAVVIYTPTPHPTSPCGACRQVLNEFGPDCFVVSICDSAERTTTRLSELLPGAFGPKNLRG